MDIKIPFNLDESDLVLDDAARGANLAIELIWINNKWAQPEELERIITAAACLLHVKAGTVAECLRTAIIWERG